MAGESVKRIKTLLDRHTANYADWHRILPLAQLQLNSHVHTGTAVSPFMALFGYEPFNFAQLENQSLLPAAGSGSEFLRETRTRMMRLHGEIQRASDALKQANADAANARQRLEVDSRARGRIQKGGWIRILRGTETDAAYVRKHGHGAPWKFRYQVEDVRPRST